MIKHIWTVLCKKSVIDQETNNLSLYEILEKITVEIKAERSPEIQIPLEFEIISMWTKISKRDYVGKFRINMMSPEGKKLGESIENEISIPANIPRLRTRLKIKGITLIGSGNYYFDIYSIQGEKTEKVASVPLEVELKPVKNVE